MVSKETGRVFSVITGEEKVIKDTGEYKTVKRILNMEIEVGTMMV